MTLNIPLPFDPAFSTSEYLFKEDENIYLFVSYVWNSYPEMFISALFLIAKKWKNPKVYRSTNGLTYCDVPSEE